MKKGGRQGQRERGKMDRRKEERRKEGRERDNVHRVLTEQTKFLLQFLTYYCFRFSLSEDYRSILSMYVTLSITT